MADAIRVGLFALSLGMVVTTSVMLVGSLRLGGAGTVLALWVVGTGQIVLLAEGLSLLGALDWPGFLIGHLLILGAVAGWARRRPPEERWRAVREVRAGLARLWPVVRDLRLLALPPLAGALLVVGAISTFQALWVPPTSADSLSYHLTRVGYYLQFRSLAHYPTDDWRQVAFPPNAELLILWTVAFLRADWLANLVQLLAWVVTTVAVYGVGRQLGFGAPGALFAAGLFALLPQSVLQSTSTLNDLTVTSFVVACLYFLFETSVEGESRESVRPLSALTLHSRLVLAGAAAGLAAGTKGTGGLALPGLAVVFVALFWRRLDRGVLVGMVLGGVAAALLGAQTYVQNLLLFDSPIRGALRFRASLMPWESPFAYLARMLFQFSFADLSGPLATPAAQPLGQGLARMLAAIGERLFAALGIPTAVDGRVGIDLLFTPRIQELYSGVGQVGGLMIAAALLTLVWFRRIPPRRRLVGFMALSHLILIALTLRWVDFAPGRFILTACAVAAPLLGALLRNGEWRMENGEKPHASFFIRHSAFRTALALVLAVWSGMVGLSVARFNEDKPLSELFGRDRLGLITLNFPQLQAFFREADEELGPTSTVGVYGAVYPGGSYKGQWEYLFFGPRFSRTLLPLVGPDYVERRTVRQPPPWSNADLIATHQPAYIVVESVRPGAAMLPDLQDRCFELPLEHGKPTNPWELWRCRDDDPRSVLEHGDFQAGPTGWVVEVAGEGRLDARALEPEAGGEPFRLRLDYRAGGDPRGEGGIVQEAPLGDLRGRVLVVDARVWADAEGAAVLWVDDGVGATEVANQTTAAETLRVSHAVHPRASGLAVHLDASGAGRDATVRVRTILAIPR